MKIKKPTSKTVDKWTNLPRHYADENVQTYHTYFYRVQEILLIDREGNGTFTEYKFSDNSEKTFAVSYSPAYVNAHQAAVDSTQTIETNLPKKTIRRKR